MIKNLLNADEDPPPGTKVIIEDTIENAPVANHEPAAAEDASAPPTPETRPSFEIPEDAQFFTKPSETPERIEELSAAPSAPLDKTAESIPALMADIENLDDKDLDALEKRLENAAEQDAISKRVGKPEASKPSEAETAPPLTEQAEASIPPAVIAENPPAAEPVETPKTVDAMPSSGTLFQTEEPPRQSMAETIRGSGLAYSAAIVLFGSVVFTMILGWFADLLLGSSPWGIVGGIILGGIIGFIQFFRITSQIFKK